MKDTCIASLVSVTLALATASSVALAQAPTAEHDGPRPIRLELDASAVGERALGLDNLLREELGPVFGSNGAQLVEPDRTDAAWLRVRIGGQFKDIELFTYELHFELVDGDKVTKLIDPVRCEKCYDDVIVPTVAAQVPALLEAVDAQTAGAEAIEDTGDGDTGDGGTGDGDTGDGDSTEPPKAIGPLGFAGIGIAAIGLGATIGGAVELSRGRVYEQSAGYYDAIGKDHRPVGAALVGMGATVAVIGVVMLSVDLARRAKQREQARPQVLVVPMFSPVVAGLGVSGRF